MLLLHVRHLHHAYGHKTLFDDLELFVRKGQKIALLAQNGTGKSTLLSMIAGKEEVRHGEIIREHDVELGYLPQSPDRQNHETVSAILLHGQSEKWALLQRYETLLAAQESTEEMHDLLHQLEEHHVRDYQVLLQTIIGKLQLHEFLDRDIASLSGGEKKRVWLATVLLQQPTFLLLDEPTNHLDLDMIEWLETYIKNTPITVLMVTHDRYFLERVCTDIYELEQWAIVTYPGNYETYLTKKAEREELLQKHTHQLKQLYKKELARVRKAPPARTTKSQDRINAFESIREEYTHKRTLVQQKSTPIDISVNTRHLGNKILKLHSLSKAFGEKILLDDFTYDFRRGERIGIMWKNGVGKTTFVRMLTGQEQPDSGTIKQWETVVIGHYHQDLSIENEQKTLLEVVKDVGEYSTIAWGKSLSASQLLEQFLFPIPQQRMPVYKLSGGEKRRLHLLMILMKNPNFLILDEPTNDLDVMTLTILEDFLMTYTGCLIIISHDRYFMDKLVDHLFVFEGNGVVRDFRWTYSQYHAQRQDKETASSTPPKEPKPSAVPTSPRLTNAQKKQLEILEEELLLLEDRKEAISLQFQHQELSHDQIKELSKELAVITEQIERKEEEWMEITETI